MLWNIKIIHPCDHVQSPIQIQIIQCWNKNSTWALFTHRITSKNDVFCLHSLPLTTAKKPLHYLRYYNCTFRRWFPFHLFWLRSWIFFCKMQPSRRAVFQCCHRSHLGWPWEPPHPTSMYRNDLLIPNTVEYLGILWSFVKSAEFSSKTQHQES